jgi:mitochondrial fission protein ELM1
VNEFSLETSRSTDRPERARVWLLLGTRRGDTNQLFALANALRLPFDTKPIAYNWLRHISFLRRARLMMVSRKSRRLLQPPWPDVVIGVGYASVHVARAIRRRSRGRTKIVQIGNPRTTVDDLDLVITTPQYWRPPAQNVLSLPLPMGNPARDVDPSEKEQQWLGDYPRPRRLIAVGGPARYWRLDDDALEAAIAKLSAAARSEGGSVIVVTSPRTTQGTKALLRSRLTDEHQAVVNDFPRFAALLRGADEIYVTADSVSMISEAVLTGKPLGIIPIARSPRGRVKRWFQKRGIGGGPIPDFPQFWRMLADDKMAGSLDSPMCTNAEDSVKVAARAVMRLLRD